MSVLEIPILNVVVAVAYNAIIHAVLIIPKAYLNKEYIYSKDLWVDQEVRVSTCNNVSALDHATDMGVYCA